MLKQKVPSIPLDKRNLWYLPKLADVINGGAPVSKLLSTFKLDNLGSKPNSETGEPLTRALLASTRVNRTILRIPFFLGIPLREVSRCLRYDGVHPRYVFLFVVTG
jgi:hypothetical protein